MSLLTRLRDILLRKRPITADHRPPAAPAAALRVDELPPFNLQIAERMQFDPQVRIGLGVRNGLLMHAQAEVIGPRQQENDWVSDQWRRIWGSSAHQLLRTKLYGYLPFEVMYRQYIGGRFDGSVCFDRLLARHPRDARPLVRESGIVGFKLKTTQQREVGVLSPKALVTTFDAQFGNSYGCSLLQRAYPAWFEKWMDGGAKKTLRLRMIKDAYIGDIFWYPPDKQVQLPNGQAVSWRDIAREMLEARTSGGAMTLPLMFDADGNKLMDYTPPQDVGGATPIFDWKRDIDQEIWKALEVPPEVIEASARGSGFSGRSIPLLIALSAVQMELAELVRCVDRDILRPVAHLNFGREPQYEIRAHSLVETFAQQLDSSRSGMKPIRRAEIVRPNGRTSPPLQTAGS